MDKGKTQLSIFHYQSTCAILILIKSTLNRIRFVLPSKAVPSLIKLFSAFFVKSIHFVYTMSQVRLNLSIGIFTAVCGADIIVDTKTKIKITFRMHNDQVSNVLFLQETERFVSGMRGCKMYNSCLLKKNWMRYKTRKNLIIRFS